MKQYLLLLLVIFIASITHAQECDLTGYQAPAFFDTYHEYATATTKWTIYNVHDPSVIKDGEYYYMYGTDVAWGTTAPVGLMKRRSKDLINWEYLGTAWSGCPPLALQWVHDHQPVDSPKYVCTGLWAPFLIKVASEFRMYYSIPAFPAAIGLLTSVSANGPWTDRGVVLGGRPNILGINSIDPSIIIDTITHRHWMSFGSYEYGIYMTELDSATGLLKTPITTSQYENITYYGTRIAGRTGGRHKAIEGSELNYRNGWYYIFVSYDWLGDTYNVRVCRSRNANGPYYDFSGNIMSAYSDNFPMIQAPYKFYNHEGWQGTGHCSVYNDNGKYYMFNQARPSTSLACMVLHVREIKWINDWPVLSPERYAAFPQCSISATDIAGKWEQLWLNYNTSLKYNQPVTITLDTAGTINMSSANTWSLNGDTITMVWNSGAATDRAIVQRAWDWENRSQTITYTGMRSTGLCMWGKKINDTIVANNITPEIGATYIIRNHNSNKVLNVSGGSDLISANVNQYLDFGYNQQKWVLGDGGGGYYTFSPKSSADGKLLEVADGTTTAGANIQMGSNVLEDKKKFKLSYQNNGYFGIVSKVSSQICGLDVSNFSTSNSANVLQWTFSSTSNNQLWRLEKIAHGSYSGINTLNSKPDNITIWPNPSNGENLHIGLSNALANTSVTISIYSITGNLIYSTQSKNETDIIINKKLKTGVYIVSVGKGSKKINQKIIIY